MTNEKAGNQSAVVFPIDAAAPTGSAKGNVPASRDLNAEMDRATSDCTRFLAEAAKAKLQAAA